MSARANGGAAAVLALAAAGPCVADDNGQSFSRIERGRYLATVGDCGACHTAPGGKPMAGGAPIETPFGTLISPNITFDRETGIGAWSEDDFYRAMHEGVGRGGEHLYPAFPYTSFTKATRDDVLAIRDWLRTLAPVSNKVVGNQLPFPFDVRASMIAWNAANFTPGEFKAWPGRSAEWNRGAYLVLGLGHCDSCHTARNWMGGEKNEPLRGGDLQGWFAPDLTNTRAGLATWSKDDIVEYLATGHNHTASATGPMAEVVTLSTSKLNKDDLAAMAIYLKSLPGPGDVAPGAAPDASAMRTGEAIYRASCSACHQPSGEGVPGLFPALAKAPDVQSADPTNVLRVLVEGGRGAVTDVAPSAAAMPAYAWKLGDAGIAAVATFIRNSWGNSAAAIDAETARKARNSLAKSGE